MNTPQRAFLAACEALGGQARMAKTLGVTASAVSQWARGERPIPAERCPDIEEATRKSATPVFCEHLAPHVRWGVIRGVKFKAA